MNVQTHSSVFGSLYAELLGIRYDMNTRKRVNSVIAQYALRVKSQVHVM